MKKIISLILTLALLSPVFLLVFAIPSAEFETSSYIVITIRSDGTVDPPTASIQRDGDLYTFTDDISGWIVVERSNIILDGKGYFLEGNLTGYGIYWSVVNNITIRNLSPIYWFDEGIHLESSDGNYIINNTMLANQDTGIRLESSDGNYIINNTIGNFYWDGIWAESSNNNNIVNNTIGNSAYPASVGIRLDFSSGNNITTNVINLGANTDFNAAVLIGNSIGLSTNNKINNNTITSGGSGIRLAENADGNSITNNTIANHYGGVYVAGGDGNNIANNVIAENTYRGVYLVANASGNNIRNNNITDNGSEGITIQSLSSGNTIFHNNFIGNALPQASSYESNNTWDIGYPFGGNYWSDYAGVDLYSGSYQNETGSDGIGDTSYVIDENNQDDYPLMYSYLWPVHDVAVVCVVPSKVIVNAGETVSVNVTIVNQGDFTESFNLLVYANTTIIGAQAITDLAIRTSTELTFTWNTTDFDLGNYTISGYATTVPNEIDTEDNTFVDGQVAVNPPVRDVAIISVSASPTVVGQGENVAVNVDVVNQGTLWETFSVTIYANTTIIWFESVSLAAGGSIPIVFNCNTTSFAFGNYTIKAVASTVPDETDTEDNTYINGIVTVVPIYTLTITTTVGGTTSPSPGTYTYLSGTAVSITATPSSGYYFLCWELDGDTNTTNPISITMETDHALHAVFVYDVTIGAYCYTESVHVSVNITMDGTPTGYNTSHTFTGWTGTHTFTVPNTDANNHTFYRWSTGNPNTTITVIIGGTYTAYYGTLYNLTIAATTGGTTNPSPGTYIYLNGTIVSVTALPNTYYVLDHWELDSFDAGSLNPIVVTMDTDHELNAVFSWVGLPPPPEKRGCVKGHYYDSK